MTDQTVPVPVDLLKELKRKYGSYVSASRGPLAAVFALIPSPPKVGDVLTATQVYDLPIRSTFVDDDGDVYVVHGPRKIRRLTNTYFAATDKWDGEDMPEDDTELSEFKLTITYLPAPSDTV